MNNIVSRYPYVYMHVAIIFFSSLSSWGSGIVSYFAIHTYLLLVLLYCKSGPHGTLLRFLSARIREASSWHFFHIGPAYPQQFASNSTVIYSLIDFWGLPDDSSTNNTVSYTKIDLFSSSASPWEMKRIISQTKCPLLNAKWRTCIPSREHWVASVSSICVCMFVLMGPRHAFCSSCLAEIFTPCSQCVPPLLLGLPWLMSILSSTSTSLW